MRRLHTPLHVVALTSITSIRSDVITAWNKTAWDYVQQNAGAQTLRALTMVHVAQFDAVNGVVGAYEPYALDVSAPGASAEAAAAQAAYTVLTNLSRVNLAVLNTALSRSLASIPAGQARDDGIALGKLAAENIVKIRAADNVDLAVPTTNSAAAGKWRVVPPGSAPGDGANRRYQLPWTMRGQAEFRPPPPPKLTSAEYATDLEEVRLIGARSSTNRTTSQRDAAQFHFAGEQAYLAPSLAQHPLPLIENARLHALLYMITMDCETAFLEAQYAYLFWRPYSAIRLAANDGNDTTQPETTWLPLFDTPNHPEYPSGTCTLTSGMITLLTNVFGNDFAFTGTNQNGRKRSFERLTAAVDDAIEARIAAGAHFRNSCVQGVALGARIAHNAMEHLLRPAPELGTVPTSTGGNFTVQLFTGLPNYVVQSSADLVDWSPRRTNVLEVILHTETNASPRGFYRAIRQP